MALTNTFCRTTKPTGAPAGDKHSDGGGLYLHVKGAGKYWRLAYRFAAKQKTLAIGVYPDVSLAQAREKREQAKKLLASDIDPGAAKRDAKQATATAAANTFRLVALEYHAMKLDSWSPSYGEKWLRGMTKDLFPYIGKMPLASITAPTLLATLRKCENRGALETAHTLLQTSGQVFRYGIQTGRCESSPTGDLKGALKPVNVKNMAAITDPMRIGDLVRASAGYQGQATTKTALALSALLFQRPGNIRQLEWAWIDVEKTMLTIPAQDMKRRKHQKVNGKAHLVPLSRQAVEHLQELRPLTGHGRYVFPSLLTGTRPMSDNTVRVALRRMGFTSDEMSAHGFRAMAKTAMLERLGIPEDVIEAQLAHGKKGPLGSAYDRAEYLEQRVKMMQIWADYLDKLAAGADVIPLRTAA